VGERTVLLGLLLARLRVQEEAEHHLGQPRAEEAVQHAQHPSELGARRVPWPFRERRDPVAVGEEGADADAAPAARRERREEGHRVGGGDGRG
tara:strand:- start:3794 stop:4072 length:279 start_codon:yes stop_codon:yes gene_type:complete